MLQHNTQNNMQTRSMKMKLQMQEKQTLSSSIRRSARIQSKNSTDKSIDIYIVDIDFDNASKEWRKNKIHLGNCVFKYI